MNKKTIISIIVLLGGIFWYFLAPGNTQGFLAAYNIYDTASTAEEIAAHMPGVGENVSRQKLNGILSQVLTADMTSEERQKLSEEALVSVGELRAQIDTIGESGKKTEATLATLREASKKVGGFSEKRKARSIVALAEERSQTIKDVEEISYGINARLENIFQGIIADKGVLTPNRIGTLNQDLPEAEKEFNRLTEAYRKLDEIEKQIDTAFQGLSTEQ